MFEYAPNLQDVGNSVFEGQALEWVWVDWLGTKYNWALKPLMARMPEYISYGWVGPDAVHPPQV